ncbi:MAG: hypothetical protein RIC55_02550 [Pirellulaceae bacterium]
MAPFSAKMNITAQSARPKQRAKVSSSWPLGFGDSPGWVCTRTYHPCHAILNFGLFRREALRQHPWDEALPLSEHREWYYRVWQASQWRMAFTPSVAIDHHRDRPPQYAEDRQRTFHHVAEAKHGVYFELPEMLRRGDRPNIVVLGVGHANTSITTRQIAALGWNLGDADEEFTESVAVRAVNQDYLRSREFDSFAAASALDRLPSPWVMKDPRFVYTLSAWLPLLVPHEPLLLWITKDTAAVEASYRRRGQDPAVVKPREQLCRQHFADWPLAKLRLDAAQIATAAALFDPNRHHSHEALDSNKQPSTSRNNTWSAVADGH